MSDKDISLRSAIFLVIGILLLLSLVICIYIVNGEKDLVAIDARVIYVKENIDGNGKNEVTVTYRVNNQNYEYPFYYKKAVKIDDTIKIYYHSNNPLSVQTIKTSFFIFVCPVIGLLLCIFGLIELFRKSKIANNDESLKTQVIEINGNTQKLEIITDDDTTHEYVKLTEEEQETPVKELVGKDSILEDEEIVIETRSKKDEESIKDEEDSLEIDEGIPKIESEKQLDSVASSLEETNILEEFEKIADDNKKVNVDDYLLKNDKSPSHINKKITKLIPKYYYVNGTTLVYEVYGEETSEINLKDVTQVIRTINSEGVLVKVVINTREISCLLTNMNKVNLLEVSNLIHNKMLDLDLDYDEVVEYKEF